MVTFETVLNVVPVVSLVIVGVYYSFQIRNQNRTRQAQLFMNLQQRFDNPQIMGAFLQSREHNEISFDEWYGKFGPDGDREMLDLATFGFKV